LVEHYLPGSTPIWNGTKYVDWTGVNDSTEVVQTDGRGRVTRSIFDFAGRLMTVMNPGASVQPSAGSKHQPFSQFFEYDTASRLTDVYQGDNVRVTYMRDGAGRILSRSTPSAGTSSVVSFFHGRDFHKFDVLGRVLATRHQYGPSGAGGTYMDEEFAYDALGRKQRESFKYLYGVNWVDVESSYTGDDPFRDGVTYDNNLTGDVDDLWLDYTPDAIGRLSQMHWRTTSAGTPELLGEYLHEGSPIRRRTTHWGTGTNQNFHTDYRYDAYGRMDKIEQSFSTAATVEFVYDGGVANGFMVSASNLVKEIYQKQGGTNQKGDRFTYDEHLRLAKSWLGSDQTHLNATDPEASVGTWHKKLTYGLDASNNRTSVASQPGPGGSVTTETYSTQDAGETGGESNRYDAVGGVVPLYDQRGNTLFDGTCYYVYDDQNRLTEVYILQEEGSQSSSMTTSSSLSVSSSLEARTRNAGVFRVTDVTALAQARSRILTRLPGGPMEIVARAGEPGLGSTLRERLSPSVVQKVSPSTSTSSSLQSSSSTQSSESPPYTDMDLVAVYQYDSANRRVMRSVIEVQTWFTAWDGWSEAQEMILGVEGANLVVKPQRQFVWGEQLDELVSYRYRQPGSSTWAEFFVAEGGAHCPSRVLNDAGVVVEVQEYDAYGKASIYNGSGTYVGGYTQNSVGNPFQWKGHRVDPETGLTYMRNRYYSSAWGRFLTQDPLGVWGDVFGMGNAYQYAASSPLVRSDEFGLQTNSTPISFANSSNSWASLNPDIVSKSCMQCHGNADIFSGGLPLGAEAFGTEATADFYREFVISAAITAGLVTGGGALAEVGVALNGAAAAARAIQARLAGAAPAARPYIRRGLDNVVGRGGGGKIEKPGPCPPQNPQGSGGVTQGTPAPKPPAAPATTGTAAKPVPVSEGGRLVIGRTPALQKLLPGERSLLPRMPNLGSKKANWKQNAGLLRQEMRRGQPIRDASPGDRSGEWLNAERNLLKEHGWRFDASTNLWMPPGKGV
jgi:RHS repeat-associated protein